MKKSWIQIKDISEANTLLILPCNAAACIGNYFNAEYYSKKKWNTWREADLNLRDLREKGKVAFAAVDSVTLETQPDDPRGALVLETEMDRVKNEEGEDWGAPSWKWFRPTPSGKWNYLEELTAELVKGVKRVESLGFERVVTLVNPCGYFFALAAAIEKCGLSGKWLQFRVPAHPRYLLEAVREVAPIVKDLADGKKVRGGIYPIPRLYPALVKESKLYKDKLPVVWRQFGRVQSVSDVKLKWKTLAV